MYGWPLHRADERSVVAVRVPSVVGSSPMHTSGSVLDIMGGHASKRHHPCYGHPEVFSTRTPPVVAVLPRVPGLPAFLSRRQSPFRRVGGYPRYVLSPYFLMVKIGTTEKRERCPGALTCIKNEVVVTMYRPS